MQADLSAYLRAPERFGWRTLDFRGTQIQKLPDSIGQLSNLQTLDFRGTPIGKLPANIGQLSNLQKLYLRGTHIRELPASIGQLSNLQTLDLCGCHLKEIPYGVVKLGLPFVINNKYADNCINLTSATLDDGDITLFSKPQDVIEAYYRDRVREAINECKVIFLGDGAAGKSSLIERIVNKRFKKDSLPTDGVKMTKWQTALDGAPFTLRFLDFGGQEIMHSMHRCFLTEHTVYVIVCESRNDTEIDEAAARWLSTVRSFSEDCPVILALNKADLNPNVSVNERELRQANPALKRVLKTSAAVDGNDDELGAERLLKAIMKQVSACVQKMTGNRDFLVLKRKLEEMQSDEKDKRKDYLTPDEFRAECETFRIAEKLREGLLDWFQDLGVAYTYMESEKFSNRKKVAENGKIQGISELVLKVRK